MIERKIRDENFHHGLSRVVSFSFFGSFDCCIPDKTSVGDQMDRRFLSVSRTFPRSLTLFRTFTFFSSFFFLYFTVLLSFFFLSLSLSFSFCIFVLLCLYHSLSLSFSVSIFLCLYPYLYIFPSLSYYSSFYSFLTVFSFS